MTRIQVVTPDNLGKSIKKNETSNKFEVNVDGSTITINEQGQLIASSSGLDCEAIDQLPIKPWKKDTVVLAKQDGECIRLKPNGDIFTDIVVDLASNKQGLEIAKGQSETIDLIATVTNAGVNPTGEVFVTLTKPQLGTYQLGAPTTNDIGETKTGELTWKVPSMDSGRALVITLPVTLSTVGSFSFGLQATSTIDTDINNNSKTFTFTVAAKNDGTNTNYVPSKDCPLIIATDLTHNQRLNVFTPSITDEEFKTFGKYINVFADKRGFAGKQIKLEGASTVIATAYLATVTGDTLLDSKGSAQANTALARLGPSYKTSYRDYGYNYDISNALDLDEGVVIGSNAVSLGAKLGGNFATPVYSTDMGKFDASTQIFTFNSNLALPTQDSKFNDSPWHCVLWCRPPGQDCKWQGIIIELMLDITMDNTKNETLVFNKKYGNVEGSVQAKSRQFEEADFVKMANFIGGDKPKKLEYTNGSIKDIRQNTSYEATVTVTSGQEAQFTISSTGGVNNLPNYISTGKTRTSYDASTKTLTVTVAADATSTDSIYWDDLKIIVR